MRLYSVVIPSYNRSARLKSAIDSILDQTSSAFEIIVVDDGSTDDTRSVVEGFEDDRIRYFYKQNEERAIARNYGVAQARGDYITFLDSDDCLYSDCFSNADELLRKVGDPEWFHLAYEIKDESSKVVRTENQRTGDINGSLLTGNHLSCIGVFLRKDVALGFPFENDRSIIGSEDYVLWLKLASRFQLQYSNKISAYMTQHSNRSVLQFDAVSLQLRVENSVKTVIADEAFLSRFDTQVGVFMAHRYLYLALHLAMISHHGESVKYLMFSIIKYPLVILNRKFFGVIKNLFL